MGISNPAEPQVTPCVVFVGHPFSGRPAKGDDAWFWLAEMEHERPDLVNETRGGRIWVGETISRADLRPETGGDALIEAGSGLWRVTPADPEGARRAEGRMRDLVSLLRAEFPGIQRSPAAMPMGVWVLSELAPVQPVERDDDGPGPPVPPNGRDWMHPDAVRATEEEVSPSQDGAHDGQEPGTDGWEGETKS